MNLCDMIISFGFRYLRSCITILLIPLLISFPSITNAATTKFHQTKRCGNDCNEKIIGNPFEIRPDILTGVAKISRDDNTVAEIFNENPNKSYIKHQIDTYDIGAYSTICWTKIKTITEYLNNSEPTTVEEYAVSFETPANIPEEYSVQNENKEFFQNTRKSFAIPFEIIEKTATSITKQNKFITCGSGPLYTKEVFTWPFKNKRKVEIRVSPLKFPPQADCDNTVLQKEEDQETSKPVTSEHVTTEIFESANSRTILNNFPTVPERHIDPTETMGNKEYNTTEMSRRSMGPEQRKTCKISLKSDLKDHVMSEISVISEGLDETCEETSSEFSVSTTPTAVSKEMDEIIEKLIKFTKSRVHKSLKPEQTSTSRPTVKSITNMDALIPQNRISLTETTINPTTSMFTEQFNFSKAKNVDYDETSEEIYIEIESEESKTPLGLINNENSTFFTNILNISTKVTPKDANIFPFYHPQLQNKEKRIKIYKHNLKAILNNPDFASIINGNSTENIARDVIKYILKHKYPDDSKPEISRRNLKPSTRGDFPTDSSLGQNIELTTLTSYGNITFPHDTSTETLKVSPNDLKNNGTSNFLITTITDYLKHTLSPFIPSQEHPENISGISINTENRTTLTVLPVDHSTTSNKIQPEIEISKLSENDSESSFSNKDEYFSHESEDEYIEIVSQEDGTEQRKHKIRKIKHDTDKRMNAHNETVESTTVKQLNDTNNFPLGTTLAQVDNIPEGNTTTPLSMTHDVIANNILSNVTGDLYVSITDTNLPSMEKKTRKWKRMHIRRKKPKNGKVEAIIVSEEIIDDPADINEITTSNFKLTTNKISTNKVSETTLTSITKINKGIDPSVRIFNEEPTKAVVEHPQSSFTYTPNKVTPKDAKIIPFYHQPLQNKEKRIKIYKYNLKAILNNPEFASIMNGNSTENISRDVIKYILKHKYPDDSKPEINGRNLKPSTRGDFPTDSSLGQNIELTTLTSYGNTTFPHDISTETLKVSSNDLKNNGTPNFLITTITDYLKHTSSPFIPNQEQPENISGISINTENRTTLTVLPVDHSITPNKIQPEIEISKLSENDSESSFSNKDEYFSHESEYEYIEIVSQEDGTEKRKHKIRKIKHDTDKRLKTHNETVESTTLKQLNDTNNFPLRTTLEQVDIIPEGNTTTPLSTTQDVRTNNILSNVTGDLYNSVTDTSLPSVEKKTRKWKRMHIRRKKPRNGKVEAIIVSEEIIDDPADINVITTRNFKLTTNKISTNKVSETTLTSFTNIIEGTDPSVRIFNEEPTKAVVEHLQSSFTAKLEKSEPIINFLGTNNNIQPRDSSDSSTEYTPKGKTWHKTIKKNKIIQDREENSDSSSSNNFKEMHQSEKYLTKDSVIVYTDLMSDSQTLIPPKSDFVETETTQNTFHVELNTKDQKNLSTSETVQTSQNVLSSESTPQRRNTLPQNIDDIATKYVPKLTIKIIPSNTVGKNGTVIPTHAKKELIMVLNKFPFNNTGIKSEMKLFVQQTKPIIVSTNSPITDTPIYSSKNEQFFSTKIVEHTSKAGSNKENEQNLPLETTDIGAERSFLDNVNLDLTTIKLENVIDDLSTATPEYSTLNTKPSNGNPTEQNTNEIRNRLIETIATMKPDILSTIKKQNQGTTEVSFKSSSSKYNSNTLKLLFFIDLLRQVENLDNDPVKDYNSLLKCDPNHGKDCDETKESTEMPMTSSSTGFTCYKVENLITTVDCPKNISEISLTNNISTYPPSATNSSFIIKINKLDKLLDVFCTKKLNRLHKAKYGNLEDKNGEKTHSMLQSGDLNRKERRKREALVDTLRRNLLD